MLFHYLNLLELFQKMTGSIFQIEQDTYRRALIKRLKSSIDASILLIDQGFYVESPVQQRVAIEHGLRILFLAKTPSDAIPATMFKAFGYGPRPTKLAKEFDLELLYKFQSAFTHPDLLSLLMTEDDNNDEFNKEISSFFLTVTLLSILLIFKEVYPQCSELLNEEELFAPILEQVLTYPTTLFHMLQQAMDNIPEEMIKYSPAIVALDQFKEEFLPLALMVKSGEMGEEGFKLYFEEKAEVNFKEMKELFLKYRIAND